MGLSVLNPPAVSGGKTLKKVTLTSGSSYTVPTGVTEINVLLVGGGGGSAKVVNAPANGTPEGYPGETVWSTISTSGGSSISYSIGAGGTGGNTNSAGDGGNTTMTGATTANGGKGGRFDSAAQSGSYSAANNGGRCGMAEGSAIVNGGAGGQGWIVVEYWS